MSSTIAHVTTEEWDNVLPGIWYGCAIIERPDGETDYVYSYSNVKEYAPDPESLTPEGCKYLEGELYLTRPGRHHMWREGDRWSFEEQKGPDAVTYDMYDAEMTL